jgi:hypothetical protein
MRIGRRSVELPVPGARHAARFLVELDLLAEIAETPLAWDASCAIYWGV